MKIDGLAAIVTGGASGLGAASVQRLCQAGARVTIFDRDTHLGPILAEKLGCRFLETDVTDESAVADGLEHAEQSYGKARILVNCAGLGTPAKVIDRSGTALPLSAFSKILAVNLIGTFNVLSQFAARIQDEELIGEERGVIVNTASVAAFDGQIGQAAYAASKGGIVSMALPIAREFARFAVRVVTIAPGIFWTPMLGTLSQEAQDSLGRQVPFPNRLGQPDEYAMLVEHIVENPMLNGEVIRLDGAIRMAPK